MFLPNVVESFLDLDTNDPMTLWAIGECRALLNDNRDGTLDSKDRVRCAAAFVRQWRTMNDQQKTVTRFLSENNIRVETTLTHVTLEKGHYRAHYAVTWTHGGTVYQHPFNTGVSADSLKKLLCRMEVEKVRSLLVHTPGPLAADILYCVLSDASMVDYYGGSIDDFAAEMCEGVSFSETLRIWEACCEAKRKVAALFRHHLPTVEELMADY